MLDDQPVTGFRSSKAQALLFYLAATGRPHTRAALAGLFWGDVAEQYARRSLTSALSNLRQLVGDDVTATRDAVAFAHNDDSWLDIEAFKAEIAANHIESLQRAAALYQGDFLEGFFLADAPEFEQWLLTERTRYRETVLQALQALAEQLQDAGDTDGAMNTLRRLLTLEPWREEAHRHLILLLAQSGQRSAALAQFELCRHALASELDVEPDAATIQLVEQIRRGDVKPQPPAAPPPQSSPAPPPPRIPATRPVLPTPPTPFVGRVQDLVDIQQRLRDPDCRLLTLVGTGGIGKTRLALEAARQLDAHKLAQELFADGIYFVPLQPLDASSEIAPTIAKTLGLSFSGSTPPEKQLLRHLRDMRMLLVLDNFEHLLDGAPLVSEILRRLLAVKILVTTREPLDLQEAWFHPISGMLLPQIENAPSIDAAEIFTPPDTSGAVTKDGVANGTVINDAIQLFIQSARRAHPGFAADREAAEIARICRLLGGMPLGIELAAAWTRVLPCREIREEIERSFDFLRTSLQNVPARHRSLRAILEQTWRRLTEPEKLVLSKFSVFRGSCTRAAAEAVAGATLPILAALVERVLLWRTADGRYEMHELIRQFAAEKLADAEHIVNAEHADYYAAFSADHAPAARSANGASVTALLGALRVEFDNVQAAWRTALQNAWLEPIMQMTEPVARLYESDARYRDGAALLQQAAQVLQPHAARPEVARTLVGVNGWLGRFHMPMRRLAQAENFYLEQRTLAQRTGDKEHYAAALAGLARVAMDQGRAKDAEVLAQNAVDELRHGKKSRALIDAHYALGIIFLARGQTAPAAEHFQQAVAIGRQLGDIEALLPSYINLGFAAMQEGEYAKSKRLLLEALELSQRAGCKSDWGRLYYRLGRTCEMTGDYAEALTYFAQARAISRRAGNIYLEGSVDRSVGDIHRLRGDYQQARILLQRALATSQSIELTSSIGLDLTHLALLEEDEGHWELACQYLREAADLGAQSGRTGDIIICQAHLARVLVRMGQMEEAATVLRSALALTQPESFQTAALFLILAAAMHLFETQKLSAAIGWMTFVSNYAAAPAATRAMARAFHHKYAPAEKELSDTEDQPAQLNMSTVLADITARYDSAAMR
ncbi:MAG: BTAD domain-containing putative transcriptional regulator [Caldilineaceae bacterium]